MPPDTNLGPEALDEVCDLALRIEHDARRKRGEILSTYAARPYVERTPTERANMRAGALRVVQALVLLGWIEL